MPIYTVIPSQGDIILLPKIRGGGTFLSARGNGAVLRIVLVLCLICSNRVIFGVLRISVTESSAIWRLLGATMGRIPKWRTPMQCGTVPKDRRV